MHVALNLLMLQTLCVLLPQAQMHCLDEQMLSTLCECPYVTFIILLSIFICSIIKTIQYGSRHNNGTGRTRLTALTAVLLVLPYYVALSSMFGLSCLLNEEFAAKTNLMALKYS